MNPLARTVTIALVGGALAALGAGCSESYESLGKVRCPTDLLCPGGLICLDGYCVDGRGGSAGTTGTGGSNGSCASCPEIFLQGGTNGCNDNSWELYSELKSCACNYESPCNDEGNTCQDNLCSAPGGTTGSYTSTGTSGGYAGGMSATCESCAYANCSSYFNSCAFDPKNTGGTSGSVGTTTAEGGGTGSTPLGSTGTTSSGENMLSGSLAFNVATAISVYYDYFDGGRDRDHIDLWLTDDGVDTCVDQVGFADGGYPFALQHLVIAAVEDPNGISYNRAYQSVDQTEVDEFVADGGLPSGSAYSAVSYLTGTGYYSVGGSTTLAADSSTDQVDGQFNVTLWDPATNATSQLEGSGYPASNCGVVITAAAPPTCANGANTCTYATDCGGSDACILGCCVSDPEYHCADGVCTGQSTCAEPFTCSSFCCEP